VGRLRKFGAGRWPASSGIGYSRAQTDPTCRYGRKRRDCSRVILDRARKAWLRVIRIRRKIHRRALSITTEGFVSSEIPFEHRDKVCNECFERGGARCIDLALFCQVPWHKRPTIFSTLHKIDLIQPVRQQLAVGARYPAFDIAAITKRGRTEVERLDRCQRSAAWVVERPRTIYTALCTCSRERE